jgi:hypothetical protein
MVAILHAHPVDRRLVWSRSNHFTCCVSTKPTEMTLPQASKRLQLFGLETSDEMEVKTTHTEPIKSQDENAPLAAIPETWATPSQKMVTLSLSQQLRHAVTRDIEGTCNALD